MDQRRRFTSTGERVALYLAAGGRCANCGTELQPGWHADHVVAHSRGGSTDVINGQALCPPCNLKKGAAGMPELRQWQRSAIERANSHPGQNFLVTATPGAGKTRFALAYAQQRMDQRVVIVVPTKHLRRQWAEAAAGYGLHLDFTFSNDAGALARDYHGTVVTYQAVASTPDLYRMLSSNALVILDEVHHAGDAKSWGGAVRRAFEPAARRLLLSGTPFRSDGTSIPFVTYEPDEQGILRSVADYSYGYGQALKEPPPDNVVRSIAFPAFDGESSWMDAGVLVRGSLNNEDPLQASRALRTALQSDGEWIPSVLRTANIELSRARETYSDAGGLVIASDQASAQAYGLILEDITNEPVSVAVSDEPDASDVIRRFAAGDSRWLVAVQMVSEGVDIPRLTVGVYATSKATELFFRQVVGRFVRTRDADDETCSTLFLPSSPPLLLMAREIEDERDHALAQLAEEMGAANTDPTRAASQRSEFDPVGSSQGIHDQTILGGEHYGDDEITRASMLIASTGIRGVSPVQVASLLRAAGMPEVQQQTAPEPRRSSEPTLGDQKTALRKKITQLVNQVARENSYEHKQVHLWLNKTVNESSIKVATVSTLQHRIVLLREALTP